MNNLSPEYQARLDAFRKKASGALQEEKVKSPQVFRRAGKNDYGDVNSKEEWDEEIRKSQTRK